MSIRTIIYDRKRSIFSIRPLHASIIPDHTCKYVHALHVMYSALSPNEGDPQGLFICS